MFQFQSKALDNEAFSVIPVDWHEETEECTKLKNQPPTCAQDGTPLCSACAAKMLIEQNKCRLGFLNCDSPDRSKTPSLLTLATQDYGKQGVGTSLSILANGDSGTATSGMIIQRLEVEQLRLAIPDSCFPMDQVVASLVRNKKSFKDVIQYLREKYTQYKTTEAGFCFNCVTESLKTDLGLKNIEVADVKSAFKKNAFDRFLYEILAGSCDLYKDQPNITATFWPQEKHPSQREFTAKVKDLIASNRAAAVGICADHISAKDHDCDDSGHETVIAGYCKFCNSDKSQCKEAVQIKNSWGQEWQNRNHDGWVELATIYDHLLPGIGSLNYIKKDDTD